MRIYKALKMQHVWFLLTGCLAFCFQARAQSPVEEVIATEQAFAKLAVDQETRAAFLAYMSDNSLLERQGKLVNGRSIYLKLPPDTSGKLIWYPTIASSSAAGDLGYTSGPYFYQVKGKAVAFGSFATVWEKQAYDKWTFVIDLGNSHDSNKELSRNEKVEKIFPEKQNNFKNNKVSLITTDQNFNAEIQSDLAQAYLKVLHPAARILRPGKPPYLTSTEKAALFSKNVTIRFVPEGAKLASSNDLGVVYGSCSFIEPTLNLEPQPGVYMHIWRKDAHKGWQLLHESINLAPKK